jgi:hypothetical protein
MLKVGILKIVTALMGSWFALVIVGCHGMTAVAPTRVTVALQGSTFGGQQPIVGAAIYFYAASTNGYGAPNTSILTKPVTTDANGRFSIGGAYSCVAGQQMYIVAMGGNPGGGTNANAGTMAALGDCAGLNANTFINMNEITTVGSVFALAPFMSGYSAVGASSTNTVGLARAFASVNKIVNIATGTSIGSALPTGATGPSTQVNTLANVLAMCINSTGGVAGDGSSCGKLFSLATPAGGTAPADVIQATLNIARNPALNVTALYQLATPTAPFWPRLASAPKDWTISITYSNGGFSAPKSTTIDGNGNVWVANSGNNTVTVLAQSGNPLDTSPLSGNGLNGPSAIAMDASNNAWIANKNGTTVSAFTQLGATLTGSPFDGSGNISVPTAIAVDGPGNIWVSNGGNSSVTKLTSGGAYSQQITTGINAPVALAISPK